MAKLIIDGVPPWDGDYEFDWDFTNEELYRVKLISRGIRAGEIIDAVLANDSAVYVALATVILEQHGKHPDEHDFWDAKKATLSIDPSEAEGGDVLPPVCSAGEPGAEPESEPSSGGPSGSAGA